MVKRDDLRRQAQAARQAFDEETRRKAFVRKLALLLRKTTVPKQQPG